LTPIAVVAAGAVSPLGSGDAAVALGALGERPVTCVSDDASLAEAGLARPRVARVALGLAGGDRAAVLLARAAADLARVLDAAMPGWRSLRVALFIGTSGGGMDSLERVLSRRASGQPADTEENRAATYAGPLAALYGVFDDAWPRTHILAACVSSTAALGLAARALDQGDIDVAIAGGYDGLSTLIASGFESLGATTATAPRPFRCDRDGMALGEGAALLALARAGEAPCLLGTLLGFGCTSDATHVTAPDPEGRGLARAAQLALADAGLGAASIELVSAHATATRHNDAAEIAALRALFTNEAKRVVVHPYKAVLGHTLGAAGALETLAALAALRAGVLPAAIGDGEIERDFPARLLPVNEAGVLRRALKLSSAFGGSNAALVLALPLTARELRDEPPRPTAATRPPPRVLYQSHRVVEPDLALVARRSRLDPLRIERLDRESALAVSALAETLDAVPALAAADPTRVAVLVATEAGCLEANELFDARRRERGPRGVEPRRFPATSPNLPAGLCSIAFGFQGPSFALGGGPGALEQARRVAELLLRGNDADLVVVVEADDVGAVVRDVLIGAGLPLPSDGARVLVLGRP
jgi:3-oxoacyl-[acyl-carrier-protein] synthase II